MDMLSFISSDISETCEENLSLLRRFSPSLLQVFPRLLAALGNCLFSCQHGRVSVNEGKCYCPDCGQGLIYQWVLLRCRRCRGRRDSRIFLGGVLPSHRYCLQCGEPSWQADYLEAPAYFQLHKARLVIRDRDPAPPSRPKIKIGLELPRRLG
jgi:uncharacterized protein (DUF983 family)